MYKYVIEFLNKDIFAWKGVIRGDIVPLKNIKELKHCRNRITELQSAIELLQAEANKPANIKGYHDVNDFYENSEFYDDRDLQKEGEK